MNILEINNVTVYRGDTRVFQALSLAIPAGCHTAILGPNGSGKTTLLKLLTCELYPAGGAAGSVRIFGKEEWNIWELRSRLGIVSHDLQKDYLQSARGIEVVLSGFYASVGTYAHQVFSDLQIGKAEEVMDRLHIRELEGRTFSELSTGEQRRFLLARALIHDPEVLVFDEPTGGLDLRSCFQYLRIIRELIREGKTILLVTHHIHEIPPEINRVIFLKNGKIVADGNKKNLLTGGHLSGLFDTPVRLIEGNGFYQPVPL